MKRPIRVRLALWYTLVLALTLCISGAAVYVLLGHSLRERGEVALQSEADQFRALVEHEAIEEPHLQPHEILTEAVAEALPLGWRVAVFDTLGHPTEVADSTLPVRGRVVITHDGQQTQLGTPLANHSAFFGTIGSGETGWRVLQIPMEVGGLSVSAVVFRPLAFEREILEQLLSAFLLFLPALLLLTGLAGYFLARRALIPIAGMARETATISAHTLHTRLPVQDPGDELGSLAGVFNALLDRLENAFDHQRQFMTDAAHELRTPAAIIRGEAEVALSRSDRSPDDYRNSLDIVLNEAERLSGIVDDLFTLSRADAGEDRLLLQYLYLDELIEECCRSFESIATARSVRLTCRTGIEASFRGDPALLRRLIFNLMENATRHSPAGGEVHLSLNRMEDRWEIRVRDSGSGIAEEDQPFIFDRFYRGRANEMEGNQRDGAGLGLPIARWIAEAHEGELELLHSGPDGTTFRVLLPLDAIHSA